MDKNERATTYCQEVGPVSPSIRGHRVVVESPRASGLLGSLGQSLLLLGRLPI